jgi:hypothetical protein
MQAAQNARYLAKQSARAQRGDLLDLKVDERCRRSFGTLRKAIRRNIEELVVGMLENRDEPTFSAGVVLVCGLIQTGPVPRRISKVTGIERRIVTKLCLEARRAGIFRGGGVDADPWVQAEPPGASTINFVLDAMVVAGEIDYEGQRGEHRLYKAKP